MLILSNCIIFALIDRILSVDKVELPYEMIRINTLHTLEDDYWKFHALAFSIREEQLSD